MLPPSCLQTPQVWANCADVAVTQLRPTPPPCTGTEAEACLVNDWHAWCCNLDVHNCACTAFGTASELEDICSSMVDNGIDCKTCKASPRCAAEVNTEG